MTRNFGWSFLDMGRRLSRARNLAEVLLGIFGKASSGEDESGSLLFTLELADSFITYRSRYRLAPIAAAGARPAADRREQSAQRRVPAGGARAAHRFPAAVRRGRRAHRGAAHGPVAADQRSSRRCHPLAKTEPDGARPNLQKLLNEQTRPCPPFPTSSGAAISISSRRAPSGCARARATSHDFRCQPPHHVRLQQASAAIPAPRAHDARPGPRQRVHRHSLLIEPAPSSNVALTDYFGNGSAILTIEDEHSELVIHARSTVEVAGPRPADAWPVDALGAGCGQGPTRTASWTSACCSSSAPRGTPGSCTRRSTMPSRRSRRGGRSWKRRWT